MNDPRMLNDPDRAKALEHIKEIHAPRIFGAVLRFFAVVSPAQWKSIWGRELQVAFRTGKTHRTN
jgi:hypothetical protein